MKRPDVASQSTDGNRYRARFALKSPVCECAYHTPEEGCGCTHMAAVECLLPISPEDVHDKRISIKEHDLRCPDCKSKKYV